MSVRHTVKCWPENFQAIWDGVQTYTVRNNDRNYKVGDSLQIEEYVNDIWETHSNLEGEPQNVFKEGYYTGRVMGATVVHITPGGSLGMPLHICVLGVQVWQRNLFPDEKDNSLT